MYRGHFFRVREIYKGQIDVGKIEITLMDITLHCLLSSSQEPRTFEVLVIKMMLHMLLG